MALREGLNVFVNRYEQRIWHIKHPAHFSSSFTISNALAVFFIGSPFPSGEHEKRWNGVRFKQRFRQ
jgi:hypothetical protein